MFAAAPALESSGSSAAIGAIMHGDEIRTHEVAPEQWITAAGIAARLVHYLAGCDARTSLNLNVPDAPPGDVRNLRPATVQPGGSKRLALDNTTPGSFTINWFDRATTAETPTDANLIRDGHATLVHLSAPGAAPPEPFPRFIMGNETPRQLP